MVKLLYLMSPEVKSTRAFRNCDRPNIPACDLSTRTFSLSPIHRKGLQYLLGRAGRSHLPFLTRFLLSPHYGAQTIIFLEEECRRAIERTKTAVF